MAKLLGKIHDRQCDCNIEQFVSGTDQKCNHRYGVKRARSKEKQILRENLSKDIESV